MKWSELAAVYGAVLATIVFSWDIFRIFQDGTKISSSEEMIFVT